jgi:hypothetical protein
LFVEGKADGEGEVTEGVDEVLLAGETGEEGGRGLDAHGLLRVGEERERPQEGGWKRGGSSNLFSNWILRCAYSVYHDKFVRILNVQCSG